MNDSQTANESTKTRKGYFLEAIDSIMAKGLFWEDEDSYFLVHSQLVSLQEAIQDMPEPEAIQKIISESDILLAGIQDFKNDLAKYTTLSERQVIIIARLNRLVFFCYLYIQNVSDTTRITDFIIADKLIQGALISGLNGANHKLFYNELMDIKSLIQAVDFVSKSKPVVEKYGKSVSAEDKVKLSELTVPEELAVAKKVLQEDPIQLLARVPSYKNGILTKL